MIGAMTGDIVGSIYEWDNHRSKDFPLFQNACFFTDDSVMTAAVAKAIMDNPDNPDFAAAMKQLGNAYPGRGYGGRFQQWLWSKSSEPYNSFGNGSPMRVSPCAWAFDTKQVEQTGKWPDVAGLAAKSAAVTHNHPEGIKGAQAIADAIFIGRLYHDGIRDKETGELLYPTLEACKQAVKERCETVYGYDLSSTVDEIRPVYQFDETCQKTVPPAVIAFLESTDFEDAIRNAISIGGDSDTLAAITGSVAEAVYGIDEPIKEKTLSYLDKPLRNIVDRFYAKAGHWQD